MSNENPIKALDASFYTDPKLFEVEKKGLLASTWQFAGHVSQVESVGDYFSFEIAGESLFCIRDKSGELHAYYNVCQHRAHQLVSGAGSAKLIVCPYHAWTYELTGEMRGGPNTESTPGFDKSKICLASAKLKVFHGFIFVNLDTGAAPMDEWFPGVREELKAFVPHIDDLRPIEWVEVAEKCNWKISIENYSECYHCSRCHPTFANGVVKPSTYDIQPQGYCLRHTTECQNLDQMTYPIDVESNQHAGEYSSWFLWPMFSFQVYPGNILNTYHWRAIDHENVVVWRGWYSINGVESETVRALAIQDRETTVEEDIHLVESVQRGLNSRGYTPGPLVLDEKGGVNSEHSIKALHEWMRAAINN